MKILKLRITNFLAIGDSGVLNLDRRGLVLLQGVNEDDSSATSNGVGKSSIPDALSWCLYGETARGISGDAVVNKTRKKNCLVEALVQIGENEYRVARHRKHAEFKNQTCIGVRSAVTPTDFIDISKGTEKETQDFICAIVGCSKDVFMAAIYAGQENAPDLPSMGDKQLKLLIEEAAGVEKIEAALLIAREKAAAVAHEHKELDFKVNIARADLVTRRSGLLDTREVADKFEMGRKEGVEQALGDAKHHLFESSKLGRELAKLPDPAPMLARLTEINAELHGRDEKLATYNAESRTLTNCNNVVVRATRDLEHALRLVKQTKLDIDDAPNVMKRPCGECGKAHTEAELDEFVSHLHVKLERQKIEARDKNVLLIAAKKDAALQQEKVDLAAAAIPDVVKVADERALLTEKINYRHATEREMARFKTVAANELKRAKALRDMENPNHGIIERTEKYIVDAEAKLAAGEAKLASLDASRALHDAALKVFGPTGVRAHILDTVTPYLNERTADYLSALSDGNISAVWSTLTETAKGDLREKFNIEVCNDKGAESFAGLSGGEKRKVKLSTMLALQDLVASRATNPVNVFFGDEIDEALDPAGLERLMGILERKAREKGTVLIVSHNDLKDWCDQVATVTKKDGISSVSGTLND